jgi:hypothetical protein
MSPPFSGLKVIQVLAACFMLACHLAYSSILKMVATSSSETLATLQWTTQCYIPGSWTIQKTSSTNHTHSFATWSLLYTMHFACVEFQLISLSLSLEIWWHISVVHSKWQGLMPFCTVSDAHMEEPWSHVKKWVQCFHCPLWRVLLFWCRHLLVKIKVNLEPDSYLVMLGIQSSSIVSANIIQSVIH